MRRMLTLVDPEISQDALGLEITVELERSGFHVLVSCHPAHGELVVGDPTEGWDDGSLPPLIPLDEDLVIDLSGVKSHAVRSETAHRVFAAAGLLDATGIRLRQEATSLRPDLVLAQPPLHRAPGVEPHQHRPRTTLPLGTARQRPQRPPRLGSLHRHRPHPNGVRTRLPHRPGRRHRAPRHRARKTRLRLIRQASVRVMRPTVGLPPRPRPTRLPLPPRTHQHPHPLREHAAQPLPARGPPAHPHRTTPHRRGYRHRTHTRADHPARPRPLSSRCHARSKSGPRPTTAHRPDQVTRFTFIERR